MKILFILYGDFSTNTANPICLFANELSKLGHQCVIAVPDRIETSKLQEGAGFTPILYEDVLKASGNIFPDGTQADVIHACTPRRGVYEFLVQYLSIWPTPLVLYLEDNEFWISSNYLGLQKVEIFELTDQELDERIPLALSHPIDYQYFTALADLAIVIQDKLKVEVPPFIPCRTIPWGVDHEKFKPDLPPSDSLRKQFGIAQSEKIIVYHGGLNGFTRPAMLDLCKAVELINTNGISCKLIRTGSNAINFWDELSPNARNVVIEIGVVPKENLSAILGLADIYIQPGRVNPFEDLRLPSKLLEFLSMGKPVIVPNVNIAELMIHGQHAWILEKGEPEEIAAAALFLFQNPNTANLLARGAGEFAKIHFDLRMQTTKLVAAYIQAMGNFDAAQTKQVWGVAKVSGILSAAIMRIELMMADQKYNNYGLLEYILELLDLQAQRLKRLSGRVLSLELRNTSLKDGHNQNEKAFIRRLIRKLRLFFGG